MGFDLMVDYLAPETGLADQAEEGAAEVKKYL